MSQPPGPLMERLRQHGQEHVLRFWDRLNQTQQADLAVQLEQIDFEELSRLSNEKSGSAGQESPAQRATRAEPPRQYVPQPASDADRESRKHAAEEGQRLLREGKVGAILVAGGQGTRLGFDKPKGMFPVGPLSGKTLFQLLAEQLLARSRRAGVTIPYFVMTSDATHDATVAFFREQNYFGLPVDSVHFFKQGNMPAVDDKTHHLLLSDLGQVARSPDGHGGMLQALARSGLLTAMEEQKIEQLYYHQVDNPAAIVCDPEFLGLHRRHNSLVSTKVVMKRGPEEKMGVVCDVDGRTQIIEYSDLPPEVAAQTDADGRLKIGLGNMAIHVFERSFLQSLTEAGGELPFHRAHKKVPHLNEQGERIEPSEPNAYKFERFIFDSLPRADVALVVEADRREEFNPVKNADGADSPATSKAALQANYRRWLRAAGAEIDDDVPVEVSPLFALDETDLRARELSGKTYSQPTYLEG